MFPEIYYGNQSLSIAIHRIVNMKGQLQVLQNARSRQWVPSTARGVKSPHQKILMKLNFYDLIPCLFPTCQEKLTEELLECSISRWKLNMRILERVALNGLAPMSFQRLSGRASAIVVIGRSQVGLLLGELRFSFSEYLSEKFTYHVSCSFCDALLWGRHARFDADCA